MGAEAEGGARVEVGRAGGLGVMGRLQGQISTALQNGSVEARVYAERIIARLDEICGLLYEVRGRENERTTLTKAVAANTTERLSDGRPGYMGEIERIAITADAATDVDIFVGSESDLGFRWRGTFAVADRDHDTPEIAVPEGAPIFVRAGAGAARVVLQVKRQKVNA